MNQVQPIFGECEEDYGLETMLVNNDGVNGYVITKTCLKFKTRF